MASEVDVCNLALGHLGDEAEVVAITPADGSVQAMHCKRFYPIARDAMLERFPFSFATVRASLALLDLDSTPAEWAYGYAKPNALKILAVYPPAETTVSAPQAIYDYSEFINRCAKAFPFTVESLDNGSEVIYSNVEDATVMYTRRVTDTAKFSPLFVAALARILASYLAGPILKGKVGMAIAKAHMEWFEKVDFPLAITSNAQNARDTSYDTFIPSGLAARR